MEEAWEQFGRPLYWFVLSLVCSKADAEDVLQNVFLGLVRAHGRSGEVRSLKAYLYQAARNEAFRCIRQRGATVPVDPEGSTLLVQAPDDRLGQELDVSRALAGLPVDQREVLVLKLWHGMTFDEIAGLTGVTLNTAASRYRYGTEKLRHTLGEKEVRGD